MSLSDAIGANDPRKAKPALQSARREPKKSSNGNSPEDRARAYIAKMPEAIEGSGGSVDCFNVARKLVHGFALDDNTAFRILRDDYGPRCVPPWTDETELWHKITDARSKAKHTDLVPEREPEKKTNGAAREYSDDGGKTWTATPQQPDGASEVADLSESPTAEEPLRGLTYLGPIAIHGRARLLEIAATPVVYAWQDILVVGTIMLIAGPPAEGKTTLLFLGLAARLNTSEAVVLLGRKIEPAPAGKFVVLIEGEHSESSTVRKLVKSMKLLGVDDVALERVIVVARKAVILDSPEWMDVVKLCSAGLVSDIGLDTIARVAPADANDEREQVAIFNLIAMAIEAAPDGTDKPSVWAVAHTRKNDTSGSLSDVSGSAQRTGQADTVLLVKGEKVDGRTVATTITFAKLREDPDDYPTPVTFSITKGPDGESRLDSAVASDAKADDRPLEVRITELLQRGPQTKNALAKLLARSWKDVNAAISVLFSAKAICTGAPKRVKGKDCPTFELRGPIALSRQCVNPADDEFAEDFQNGMGPK